MLTDTSIDVEVIMLTKRNVISEKPPVQLRYCKNCNPRP